MVWNENQGHNKYSPLALEVVGNGVWLTAAACRVLVPGRGDGREGRGVPKVTVGRSREICKALVLTHDLTRVLERALEDVVKWKERDSRPMTERGQSSSSCVCSHTRRARVNPFCLSRSAGAAQSLKRLLSLPLAPLLVTLCCVTHCILTSTHCKALTHEGSHRSVGASALRAASRAPRPGRSLSGCASS